DNAVLGYAVLFDGVYDWELINIAVSPAHKKRGVGRALMKDCINRAKKANADRLLLEVRPSNAAAIGLYRAFGFKDDGVRKGYYADGEDALLMSLNLSTVSI
ncbi:MAG: ribosomal protein S18-alanine N-acetyltransferase, partial [Clostridia bacterium]|nr:ribosomal protein S18-alanine N-acetyltransferase [Clostridia bacterium]